MEEIKGTKSDTLNATAKKYGQFSVTGLFKGDLSPSQIADELLRKSKSPFEQKPAGPSKPTRVGHIEDESRPSLDPPVK